MRIYFKCQEKNCSYEYSGTDNAAIADHMASHEAQKAGLPEP